jgi:hypothetical protein
LPPLCLPDCREGVDTPLASETVSKRPTRQSAEWLRGLDVEHALFFRIRCSDNELSQPCITGEIDMGDRPAHLLPTCSLRDRDDRTV